MSELEIFNTEYFIDRIERMIKNEISMMFYVHANRRPTAEEYQECFENWKKCLRCVVEDFDLGIFND